MTELTGLSMVLTTPSDDYCVHVVDGLASGSWLGIYSSTQGFFACDHFSLPTHVKAEEVIEAFKNHDAKITLEGRKGSEISAIEIVFLPDTKEKSLSFKATSTDSSSARGKLRLSELIISLGKHAHRSRFGDGINAGSPGKPPDMGVNNPVGRHVAPTTRKRKLPRGVVFEGSQ